ncbi:30S ribosomal protein S13 [archaeon]|nr:30S ribosomal protein S13 [archaeon]
MHIVRIAGVEVDGRLTVYGALRKIKGIGETLAWVIPRILSIDPSTRIGTLSEQELRKLEQGVKDPTTLNLPSWLLNWRKEPTTGKDLHLIGSDLEFAIKQRIEFLKSIGCWRGWRHALGLKVRGQKTRTTGRKGMTVGVIRRVKK